MIRRRLFNFAAVVSLVLFVAISVLWLATASTSVRVASVGDGRVSTNYSAFIGTGTISLQSAYGLKTIQLGPDTNGPQMAGSAWPALPYEVAALHFGRWTDIAFTNAGRPLPLVYGYHSEIWLSLFWPLLLTAILPAIALPRFMRYWRYRLSRRSGHCAQCSYDLTGNTSGTCPECGSPVPAAEPNPPAH